MSMSCALCGTEATARHTVAPLGVEVALCDVCHAGAAGGPVDGPHWHCLTDAVWSGEAAVQVEASTWARVSLPQSLTHRLPGTRPSSSR